jgi:outer membrane protein
MARWRLGAIFSLLVAGMATTLAVAQEAPQPPQKIAFVDVQRAVSDIDEGKARLQELHDWAKPREDELAKVSKEVNDLQTEIAAKQGVASDDALDALNKQLVAKQREFEDKQRDGRREFEARQGKILKELGEKLNRVISNYAIDKHYTAVFILKPNDLVYLANSADITDAIVKLYNQQHPLATPQASK